MGSENKALALDSLTFFVYLAGFEFPFDKLVSGCFFLAGNNYTDFHIICKSIKRDEFHINHASFSYFSQEFGSGGYWGDADGASGPWSDGRQCDIDGDDQ